VVLAKVHWIVQQVVVVSAAIDDDGEGSMRVTAGAEGVDDQLCYGDENSSHTLIA